MKRPPDNPLARLDDDEVAWLFGILKDACRERLEKNLITQALEDRLYERHGTVPGRADPRPRLKEWEPRYRKLLEVACEIHDRLRGSSMKHITSALAERMNAPERRRA